MIDGQARTPDATATARSPSGSGASRGTGLVMLLTGVLGWLASFRLAVDDWRLLKNPAYQPPCNISPVVSCGGVMSSPQGSLFGFPNMLIGLGAFAAVAVLGAAVLSGAGLHRRLWLALGAGALSGVVFVHWLIAQSLYELDKVCPYCAVVWVVTIALFWSVSLHCVKNGIVPVPHGVRELLQDTHWMLLGAWYGVIALLVLTRFWPYWSSLP
ncbi:vitamin K epoxide reductase family protein [Streptomyces sp. NPDC058964]|uniref:vitamin K epoxide reductase family protein n=1 Tax=Streptomyces sp. NPDC058964 TaxID=3346681 RepID=UPI0036A17DFD